MFFPGAAVYMDKIATGPEAAGAIDLDATPAENVSRVAEAKGKSPREVTVIVLERPRHEALIQALRKADARVVLIRDGDVAPAIAAGHGGTLWRRRPALPGMPAGRATSRRRCRRLATGRLVLVR